MRILVDLGHPAHVHFYKHAVHHWQGQGDEVLLTAREKDVTRALLKAYRLEHQVLTTVGRGRLGLAREFLQREWRLWRVARAFEPDVVTAVGGAFIAPICRVMGIPSVVFTDSEHVAIDHYLTYPLASVVCTPHCFRGKAGPHQLRYRGFQELAYLHPHYFAPNPAALAEVDLNPQSRFVLLRFVAWGAGHDVGQGGFSEEERIKLVQELSQRARVLVSVEGPLPTEFEAYRVSIAPEEIHDLLYYASLYVGEGATMATEAGLLGTPAVYVSSLVGTMGNYEELARYGLIDAYQDGASGIRRAVELLDDPQARSSRRKIAQQEISQMTDVTAFVASIVQACGRGEAVQ